MSCGYTYGSNFIYKGEIYFYWSFDQSVEIYIKTPNHFEDIKNMQNEFPQSGMHEGRDSFYRNTTKK